MSARSALAEGRKAVGATGSDGGVWLCRASTSSPKCPMGKTEHCPPTTVASGAFSRGTNRREIARARAYAAIGSTPRTGRTRPSRANSPTKREFSLTSGGIAPAAARIPTAMGTSKAAPSLRRSAGARFTVIRRNGNLKPLFSSAPRMRTRPSFTPASGRPTM